MAIGLIIIGDEILSGKRTDQHFPKVVQMLKQRGLQLSWAEYVGDEPARLVALLKRSFASGDIVFSFGGIGATPSSDAAALLDDDLTTYFEAEVGSENSVEAVVDCSAGRIVAYTLVSSGVVEQGDNGVEALYDPVSWKVYGSDDGASWNEVDSRSEVAFIARFQKHIYYLAAPADYAKYKFVFKANGGEIGRAHV